MSPVPRPQDLRGLVAGKIYATEKDWHHMQPIIAKLYRDENRSLRQVREIMESRYHFHATTKMYKSRLSTWKLDKKLKEAEVVVMLRQKEDRDAAGKRSRFFLRGQEVKWDRVLQYLKHRPDLQDPTNVDIQRYLDTNLDVTCSTPSPTLFKNEIPCRIEPHSDLRLLDNSIRLIHSYLDGAFETGLVVIDGRILYGPNGKPARQRVRGWHEDMADIHILLSSKETTAAFRLLNKQLDLLKQLIREQDPELLLLTFHDIFDLEPNLAESLLVFVCRMHQAIFGEHHPLSLIWDNLVRFTAKARLQAVLSMTASTAKEMEARMGPQSAYVEALECLQVDVHKQRGSKDGFGSS
ncbi:hypothetical protein HER10_EVM0005323 [Colletotrichum scovillei]|uniref:Clr5 domain-containing protein n=1 Tax=Colletotrichum scovillei TaxID=1209932 RepID=A0A9P7R283_9PEZI|nr:uncharacterized protein HER10_EVM0005323 [Colletotrichum scovillei]KAF4779606.1 hypothetical protein HER10_EVM0005323 [Colletotrichum scovillei]KAG7046889.1 Clr5 domain-containing protein [Colletotrichum scovillei]KAG7056728.1 Clr5 domain-containing protein [Colletotrichum scovillei]KAG7066629.1 Clr5 domain-containing protein [Colletotrichum scovillei]